MTIRPVGAEIFYVDGRTDRHVETVTFRNFANAPKTLKKSTSAVTGMKIKKTECELQKAEWSG